MDPSTYKETLDRAVRLAHEGKNYLSEEEYEKLFSPLEMTAEQDALTRNYLNELHIKFGEMPEEPEEEELFNSEDGNYLNLYLEELKALPEYSAEETDEIYIKALSDDPDIYEGARQKLINLHLSSVVDIAKLYVYHGMRLEDLIGEGNIGLIMAVDLLGTVDTRQEAEGLIGKTIMDTMDAAIKEDRELKDNVEEMLFKLNKVTEAAKELSDELKRDVTIAELTENSDLSFEEIKEACELTDYQVPGIAKPQ